MQRLFRKFMNYSYFSKMAATSGKRVAVPRLKNKGKLFQVERVITDRKCRAGHEYLIKWQGYPLQECSWEPAENLTPELLRLFSRPKQIADERLMEASRRFAVGILTALKSRSHSPTYIELDLDIWRFISYNKGTPSQHRGHFLYDKDDLAKFKFLPKHWWYMQDQHGEGVAIDFPMKIKSVLSWSSAHYFKKGGQLCKAPRYPLEKLCTDFAKKACNIDIVE